VHFAKLNDCWTYCLVFFWDRFKLPYKGNSPQQNWLVVADIRVNHPIYVSVFALGAIIVWVYIKGVTK
jgi:hypothetical protein